MKQEDRDKVHALIFSGKSLNNIAIKTGIGKSTIYYHFRKIKGRTVKLVRPNICDEYLGELCGIFAGDGYSFFNKKYYHYDTSFYFNTNEKAYVDELKRIFNSLFGKPPLQYIRTDENMIVLRYRSKIIYKLISEYVKWNHTITVKCNGKKICRKSHSVNLKKGCYSVPFKVGFIRGSIDSDGHLNTERKRAMFSTASLALAINIKAFLDELNIACSQYVTKSRRPNEVNMHHVRILASDFYNFIKIIKPRNIKCARRDSNPRCNLGKVVSYH